MAVKILHKRSAVEFKNATGAQLELGELGLNYHESGPYLQCKDADGQVVQLGGVFISSDAGSAPGNPLPGKWWLRGDTLFLYDGSAWVEIGGTSSGGGGGSITVIGGDGIEATTSGATVTVSVDLAADSNGLDIVGGKLTAKVATATTLGTVKIGDGIAVDAAGEISIDVSGVDIGADLEYVPNGNNDATISNTAGNDATVPIATNTVAGLFTGAEKQKLDGITAGAGVDQNLGYTVRGNGNGKVTITNGTDASIPVVTDDAAGLMTGIQKQKLDGIEAGAGADQNLGYTADGNNAGTVTITNGTDATIPIATNTAAGLFTGAEKQKLAGIEAGAGVNQDLGYTVRGNGNGKVTITNGTDASIPVVTDDAAGLMTGTQKQKLDGISDGGLNDGRYLRIDAGTFDQTVQSTGDVTFSGLTTHADGVSVTGGDKNTIGKGLTSTQQRLQIISDKVIETIANVPNGLHSGDVGAGFSVNSTFDFSGTLVNATLIGTESLNLINASNTDTLSIFSSKTSNSNAPSSSVGKCVSFIAAASTVYGAINNYGFQSYLNIDGSKNYNFYAAGTAPNFYEGQVRFHENLDGDGFIFTNDKSGACISSTTHVFARCGDSSPNPPLWINRVSTNANPHFVRFVSGNGDGATCKTLGFIKANGPTSAATGVQYCVDGLGTPAFIEIGDIRNTTYTEFTDNASNIIKLLSPKVNGFNPSELRQHVSYAVTGEENEEETVGTVTDYNGEVLETNVTELTNNELTYEEQVEATPYVAAVAATYDEYGNELTAEIPAVEATYTTVTRTKTWTATGTQPVYQGVDQTKLIPLLTKALQEALDKIETLETRLADAGIA